MNVSTSNITKLRVIFTSGMPAVNTHCSGYPVLVPRKSCMFPGLHTEILRMIADSLGLEIEPLIMPAEQPYVGGVVNGSIDGFLGLIHNGTADTLALTVFQDDARRQYFDFTKPLYYSYSKAFLNLPHDSWNKYFAFFQSYHYTAWIGIGIALLIQCALCIVVNRIEAHVQKRDSSESVLELVWQMLRLQLMQSETLQHNLTAGKLSIVIFSLIQCTVVMGVLSSYIFSNLIRPKPPIPFKTFEQFTSLVADGTLHLVEVTKKNVFYDTIIHSNASDFSAMRKALESNPLKIGSSIRQVLRFLDEPGAVILRYEDEHMSFQASKKCNLYMTDMIFPPIYGHLVFKKGFPFMKQINEFIDKEHWRIDRLWSKYLRAYRNQVACIPPDVEVIGKKYPYIGTAIALFLADVLAIGLFVGELIVFKYTTWIFGHFTRNIAFE